MDPDATESAGGLEDRVERAAEEFLELLREGRAPEPGSFVERHAELGDALRRRLALMMALQEAMPGTLHEESPLRLEGCEILRELGRGGMGVVWLARQARLDRLVAIKTVQHPDRASLPRFEREARLGAALSHPGIVQVYDLREEGDVLYIVQEFVDGSSLADQIRLQGVLPEAGGVEIVHQAAVALQFAHEQGIVHRDVKPANLLVDRRGRVKVADLGLARLSSDGEATITRSGAVLGSIAYMSPEQFEDPRRADARSDVYSLGATLYHALTGRIPFEAPNPVSIASRHATAPRPDVRAERGELSPRIAATLQRMMAIRPEDRFQTMAEVARALGGGRAAAGVSVRWIAGVGGLVATALVFAGLGTIALLARTDPAPAGPGERQEEPAVRTAASDHWPDAGITGSGDGEHHRYRYEIEAGPGDLYIFVRARARVWSTAVTVDLIDESGAPVGRGGAIALPGADTEERTRVSLPQRQKLRVELFVDANAADYAVRLETP